MTYDKSSSAEGLRPASGTEAPHRDPFAGGFPGGQWGTPDDPARLVAWLATDEAGWITGQVINSEGGFRR